MPKTYTQQELEKKYASLPKKLQDLIYSEDIDTRLYQLAEENGIAEDGRFFFIDLIQLVLVGISPRKDLPKTLETNLGITPTIADKLAKDTEQKILTAVSAELNQIQEKQSVVDLRPVVPVVPKENILDLSMGVPKVEPKVELKLETKLPGMVTEILNKKRLSYEEVKKLWVALPEDIQGLLESADLSKDLQTIMQNKGMHADEMGEVDTLVSMVLLGAIQTREFLPRLTEIIPKQPRDKVLAVAEEINRRIFVKMQNSLREIEDTKKEVGPNTEMEMLTVPEIMQNVIHTPPPAPRASVVTTPPIEIPNVAPMPTPEPTMQIHEAKMTIPTESPSSTKDVSYINTDPKLKMIPADVKARINSDPYKEPIE
ncbi:MAG TPA: hypothetical protein VJJ22_04850 [Candidatus Paceibacterota bacterium]